jgi:small subunit ribosomal protein S18
MERGGPLSPEEQRQVMRQQGAQYHVKDFRANAVTENYVRQMPRRWRTGEVYAPRDMSPIEMAKWRVGKRPETDVVDLLGFNPLDNYKVRFPLADCPAEQTEPKG